MGVLTVLDLTIGIGVDGWLVGLAYGLVTCAALIIGLGGGPMSGRTPCCALEPRRESFLTLGPRD